MVTIMILPKVVLILVPILMLVDAQYNSQESGYARTIPIQGSIVSRNRWNRPTSTGTSVAYNSTPSNSNSKSTDKSTLKTNPTAEFHYVEEHTSDPATSETIIPSQESNFISRQPATHQATSVSLNDKVQLSGYNCKNENGYEAVPNKCNYFVECQNNIAYQSTCFDELVFDASIQFPSLPCNYRSQVQCQNQTDIIESQSPSTLKTSTASISASTPATTRKNPIVDKDRSGPNRSAVCSARNMYLQVDGKCDLYMECRDYDAIDMLCPDGLHFNPDARWPDYPCDYPQYVQCTGRGEPQPAVPSADCPHQYGYILSDKAIENDCGHYRVCIEGKAVEMFCPPGLAFNPVKAVCDWPSEVPSCNTEAYLGFTCPPASFSAGVPVITNHKYDSDCYAFYSCLNGQARILTCDAGFAFSPASAQCEDDGLVVCVNRSTPS